MRPLGFALLALATACFILIFTFWGINIWTGDARYGYMAGVFIIPTAVLAFIGGSLWTNDLLRQGSNPQGR